MAPVWLVRFLARLPVLPREARFAFQESLLNRLYRRDVAAAQKSGSKDEVESVKQSWYYETDVLGDEREVMLSRQLTREARRLRVPVPSIRTDSDGKLHHPWDQSSHTGDFYLNAMGYKQLRDAIREERAARRAARAHMINWIAAWTALLSAVAAILTAYVAVLALRK